MFKLVATTSAAALLLAAVAPAHAAATFGSATVIANAVAYTNYGSQNQGNGFGSDTEVLSSFGTSVGATAPAQADSYTGLNLDSTGTALEESTATFASAASGTLDLAGITSATSVASGGTGEAYSEGQAAIYKFSVDSASVFTLNYNYSETYTDLYFSNSYSLTDTTSGTQLASVSPSGANTSGTRTFDLAAGSYTLNVYTQIGDDAFADASAPSTSGNHEELYTFNITSAAPEPASWALMMVGVGLTGLALRGRRRAMAA
jgi:hypothetical protein